MEYSNLLSFLMVLAASVCAVVVCKTLRIPSILGYIAVGIIAGPKLLGWIPAKTHIANVAEFGIVFLMFTIGLEFSVTRMMSMRHLVFGLGGAQVFFTGIITALIAYWLQMSWEQAAVVGCIVSLSSTAIVSKQLTDQKELHALHGHNAISILLFQDLAVIPFFVLISSFADTQGQLSSALLHALANTIGAIILIFGLGYWLLRPLFKRIAATHSLELFTLSVLLVTVAAAWFTHHLGLSLALGAFMAGMMLGETEFRHQIEATIRPFRDLLLGLFFITVGMLFNVSSIEAIWMWILLLFLALTAFKMLIISSLCIIFQRNFKAAVRTGIVLAQGGEFGFALLSLAVRDQILSEAYGQVVLGALLLSMAVSPLFIFFNKNIAQFLSFKRFEPQPKVLDQEADRFIENLNNHVIMCGFGRNGQNIAKLLDDESINYIGIDTNHKIVNHCVAKGYPVIYGDASLYEILEACKISLAKAMVITCEERETIESILQQTRSHHKDLPIFVRTRDETEFNRMHELGATEIIPASLETSLTLSSHLLLTMGVSTSRVYDIMVKIRKTRYHMLREVLSTRERREAASASQNKE